MRKPTEYQEELLKALVGAAIQKLSPKQILDLSEIPTDVRPALADLFADLSVYVQGDVKTEFNIESIRAIRESLGETWEELGADLNIPETFIQRWSHGQDTPRIPTEVVEILRKISLAFNIKRPPIFKPKTDGGTDKK
ncbi:helix-turn-helix domain-containing protein [Patescibacteria group bacterium]|nr:helix-turn-helix domain-containing protein [Patescibacteria group bacterium]